jgi:diacylglycerol kinase (ATP)
VTGLRGFARSFRAAATGVRFAWRTQPHLRFEAFVGAAAIGVAVWLQTGLVAVLLACAIVLVAELVNTAVEATVDLASPERRPLAAIAKDAAAGAVLVAAAFAVAIGVAALGPALWGRLTGGGAS